MSRRQTCLALLTLGLGWIAMSGVTSAQPSSAELVEAMQGGGKVIFLRHAATVGSQVDTGRLGDRAGQRNLSEAGIEQARAIGAAFRSLDIPLDRILASPVYRARDTAEFAFGSNRSEVTMDLVADDYAGGDIGRMVAATRALLTGEPPAGENILLIGHRTPLEMVTRRRFPDTILPEGAMAIFEPGPDGPELLGTVPADAFIEAAEEP